MGGGRFIITASSASLGYHFWVCTYFMLSLADNCRLPSDCVPIKAEPPSGQLPVVPPCPRQGLQQMSAQGMRAQGQARGRLPQELIGGAWGMGEWLASGSETARVATLGLMALMAPSQGDV